MTERDSSVGSSIAYHVAELVAAVLTISAICITLVAAALPALGLLP